MKFVNGILTQLGEELCDNSRQLMNYQGTFSSEQLDPFDSFEAT